MAEGPSVQIEKKPEKKTQPAEVKFVLPFEADRVRAMLADAPKADRAGVTAQSEASNVLAAAELIEFLQKGKPRKDDQNLELYNSTLSTLAKDGKVETAISAAESMHLKYLRNLHALLLAGGKVEGKEAEMLYSHVNAISGDLDTGTRNFLKDDSWRTAYMREKIKLVSITNAVSTGEVAVAAPSELDRPAEKVQLPPIKVSLQDILSNLHPVEGIGSLPILTYSPALSWTVVSMFGSEANAQAAMDGLAAGYAVLINSPNDSGAISRASQQIYDAFNLVPKSTLSSEGKEIWTYQAFTDALAKLQAGKLKDALDMLSGESALSSIYDALNNTYTITVSERALSVLKGGTTFRYEFDSKVNAYDEYRKQGKKWAFVPLGVGMALYYETLDLVGQLTQLKASRDAQGMLTVTPENTALKGTGQAATVIPQASFGTILWKKPVEFTVYCTLGYRKWDLGTEIPVEDGTMKKLDVGKEGFFVGIYGIEANIAKAFGALEKPITRIGRIPVGIERAGLANVGGEFNPIAYISFSSLMMEKNQWRVQLFAKPELRYLLKQFSTGLEIKPEATYQPEGKNVTFFGAPVFRFEWNYANSSYVYDMRAQLGARFLEGTQVYLDFARTGEAGADLGKGMPTGWTAGLKADINIPSMASFFRKSKEAKLGELKPSRK